MITLPDGDYSTRWMLIKQSFSRQIPKTEGINKSRKTKSERGIWQRRYWEHLIRDGYVKQAAEWKYSTIHQYINE